MSEDLRNFQPGDKVEWHSQWPHEIVRGVVVAVGTRPREFGNGTETFVTVEWERCSYAPAERRSVPTWNARLQRRQA